MNLFDTGEEQYNVLCDEARKHNELYFVHQAPIIEDAAYDALLERIKAIEREHPEWIKLNSPTRKLGEQTTPGFKTLFHKRPMLSLDKVFCMEQVEKFDKRIRAEVTNPEYCLEYKMDGCAVSIWYEKGKLTHALTRGDGVKGDDITQNILAIGQMPLHLQGSGQGHVPAFIELRAEVFMSFPNFERYNTFREEEGLEPFSNPRNAAAGTLKLLDSKLVAQRGLSIAVYSARDDEGGIKNLEASWQFIHEQHLPCIEMHVVTSKMSEIQAFIETAEAKRKELLYGIDGVVIKLTDYQQANRLGSTGQYYRWGVAYKFNPQRAMTELLDIKLQVGRTGVVTPVAILKPVLLDGSVVARATLHNSEEIARKDIRLGDWVELVKGGDIIPKIERVDFSKRSEQARNWQMPTSCPVCEGPLVREEGEVAWRCSNELSCSAQRAQRLAYFVSKDAFDIEGLGKSTIAQLVERQLVREPSDLFKLTYDSLRMLEGFADLSAQKLLASLQMRKTIAFDRSLVSLNIKHLGVIGAYTLAKNFGTLAVLENASLEDILRLDGMGPKAALAIFASLHPPHPVAEVIQSLLEVGVKPIPLQEAHDFGEHLFRDKIFVLTGSLEHYTRADAGKLIRERGGVIGSSVSQKTDYVLAGLEAGSKLEKALKLGIRIFTEAEFTSSL